MTGAEHDVPDKKRIINIVARLCMFLGILAERNTETNFLEYYWGAGLYSCNTAH